MSFSVRTCVRLMDREQTQSVRGATSQLIWCGRCSCQVLQQLLLTPPSIFPKWQASSIKNLPVSHRVPEPGHRQTGRCQQWCHTGCNCTISHLIPFICWSSAAREAADLIWQIVLSAAVYLQFCHSTEEFLILFWPGQRVKIIIR